MSLKHTMNHTTLCLRTEELSPEAVTDLLTTLRPLVYKDGMCEDCHHDTEESAAIGQALLKWWSRHHIDVHPELLKEKERL